MGKPKLVLKAKTKNDDVIIAGNRNASGCASRSLPNGDGVLYP